MVNKFARIEVQRHVKMLGKLKTILDSRVFHFFTTIFEIENGENNETPY